MWILLGISLPFLVLGIVLFILMPIKNKANNAKRMVEYSGQLTFQMDQEYNKFKNTLADPKYKWVDFQVLDSKLPILLKFRLRTLHSNTFDYGKREDYWKDSTLADYYIPAISCCILGIILFIVLLQIPS